MRAVNWSARALRDLNAIVHYIAQHDEQAAFRLTDRAYKRAARLGDFPLVGRSIGRGLRQIVLYPYLIRYKVQSDVVEIVAIRHGRRRG